MIVEFIAVKSCDMEDQRRSIADDDLCRARAPSQPAASTQVTTNTNDVTQTGINVKLEKHVVDELKPHASVPGPMTVIGIYASCCLRC